MQRARLRLLEKQPFYALLLFHIKFSLDLSCRTAYTDGERIAFNPEFLKELSDRELEFLLMHEILHVVLGHCFRHQSDYEAWAFDIACDIVVNSNILYSVDMDRSFITLAKYGESMHLTPDGKEGYLYSAEEVYRMVLAAMKPPVSSKSSKKSGGENGSGNGNDKKPNDARGQVKGQEDQKNNESDSHNNGGTSGGGIDDHTFWQGDDEEETQKQTWLGRMVNATEVLNHFEPCASCGKIPAGVDRMLGELKEPTTDWRAILNEFIEEQICDYSFTPPDRRFPDSPFFLPDFNDTEAIVRDVLFMIDTSGSMSRDMITRAYSEVKGAIDQFNGKLTGKLGFFDAAVVPPIPFEDEEEFKVIQSKGGGTSFEVIFDYVNKQMSDDPPASIIILTDGFAPFPDEEISEGIPVLWMINNEQVTPPWGKTARIKEEKHNE